MKNIVVIGLILMVLLSACSPVIQPPAETQTPMPSVEPTTEGPVSGGGYPAAAFAAQADLAAKLNLPVDQIKIGDISPQEWSDSCLGLGGPAESCLAVIVPGYEIHLMVDGLDYAYRSNVDGSVLRVNKPQAEQDPQAAEIILSWQREGGIAGFCDSVTITANWFYSASSCNSSEVYSGKLTQSQLDMLQNAYAQYAAFDVVVSDGAVADSMSIHTVFNGAGQNQATEEVQKSLGDLAAEILYFARSMAEPDPEREAADIVLRDFLIGLYQGQYDWAAEMYGGDTSLLQTWNPTVDKKDLIKLLELGCTQNGLQCLAPLMVTYAGPDARGGYQFWVEFALPDGSLFYQGPCCGEEGGGPYPSRFLFTVLKVDGKWQVQELPPYMP